MYAIDAAYQACRHFDSELVKVAARVASWFLVTRHLTKQDTPVDIHDFVKKVNLSAIVRVATGRSLQPEVRPSSRRLPQSGKALHDLAASSSSAGPSSHSAPAAGSR